MRSSVAVVLLSQDERLAEAAHRAICGQAALELVVAGTFDEALTLLAEAEPCALVAHLDAGLADEDVAQLLWKTSLAPVPIPVLTVSDRYDEEHAKTLFQLGVTDYLGRGEHLAELGALLASVLANAMQGDPPASEAGTRAALFDPATRGEAQGIATAPHLPNLRRFPILGEG